MPAPPLRLRLLFWVFGRRMPPAYRRWAGEQITAPGFSRRRMRGVLGLQVLVVALPQAALAATGGGAVNLVVAVALAAVFALAARFSPETTPAQRERLLAHQGVTAEGQLVPPVPLLAGTGWSPAAVAALVANAAVLVTGIVVVADRYVSPDRCREAPAAQVAALEAVVGRPLPGVAPPDVAAGTARLAQAQRVDSAFDGIYYLAADVRAGDGRALGPAVWRVIEPGAVLPVLQTDISAADPAARALTPTLGYSASTPQDPLVAKARACVRGAG